ncbi:hypothetical protein AOQ73_04110 [Bradyrhizobium pachyrhizi]|nr:hypothetical protein AOQ73_04110 [Bradyrhizobium pachyrhizi]OMI14695.1 hypothetical protein BSN85_04020 [Bradyrhizobium brasilense]
MRSVIPEEIRERTRRGVIVFRRHDRHFVASRLLQEHRSFAALLALFDAPLLTPRLLGRDALRLAFGVALTPLLFCNVRFSRVHHVRLLLDRRLYVLDRLQWRLRR